MSAPWEAPLGRAKRMTRRTLAWFPVRVWRSFLQNNGFLLAAGVSYQALFSMFALVYVAFATVGLWLGNSTPAMQRLIDAINGYVPGMITENPRTDGGLFSISQVEQISSSIGALAVTGALALVTAIWTAIGFITFTRRAVRDIFGIPPDRRSYLLLKARDFVAALVFATLLLLGSALNAVGTWAMSLLFHLLGWSTQTHWYLVTARLGSVVVGMVVFSLAIAGLLMFLVGVSLTFRMALPGALLGGFAITVLQLGAGLLLSYTPSNPLLATFAVFIGLLLWFRLIGIILLVASSWVSVSAHDADADIMPVTEEERRRREHEAQLRYARERLSLAIDARLDAPWWRARSAQREVQEALDALAELEAADDARGDVGALH